VYRDNSDFTRDDKDERLEMLLPNGMSAFGVTADITICPRRGSFGPKAEVARVSVDGGFP
jgi:hypothetical protein